MDRVRIKLRSPAATEVLTLASDSTVEQLLEKIKEKSGGDSFQLKRGFPPVTFDLQALEPTSLLSSISPSLNGEQLILSKTSQPQSARVPSPAPVPTVNAHKGKQPQPSRSVRTTPGTGPRQPEKAAAQDSPEILLRSYNGTLLVRVMPDDNSCLFSAINHAALGSSSSAPELRAIVASTIKARPEEFSDAVLGRSRDSYCRWIQQESSWGGYIELSIFSQHFDLEISSIDVESLRVDRVNEGRPNRCILVYSGIHYDAVALSPGDSVTPPEFDRTQFPSDDEVILKTAVELCRKLQGKGYFTNTSKFSLVCRQCGTKFVGEKEAVLHASKTGHTQLEEYKP